MQKLLPEEIEKRSFEIITKELGGILLDEEIGRASCRERV